MRYSQRAGHARTCITLALNAMAPLTPGEIVDACPDFAESPAFLREVLTDMIQQGDVVPWDPEFDGTPEHNTYELRHQRQQARE